MNKHMVEQALRELDPVAQFPEPVSVDEQLLATVLSTPAPAATVPYARRARRRPMLALGGAVAVAIGVGAAATAGVLPDRFAEVFPWMADHQSDSTPQIVAVIDGPWGSEIRYFESVADNGTVCLNHVQVAPGQDAAALVNAKDWTAGGTCGTRGRDIVVPSVAGGPWYYDMTGTAGDAVSADIEVSNGTVYPVTIADGWLMGWFGAEPDQTAVLTGYDQDGQPLARIQLLQRQ